MDKYRTLGLLTNVLDIAAEQLDNVHGRRDKDMLVYHETVSPDYKGWSDIRANSAYLDKINYGIHGLTDEDGNAAWAYGLGNAVFWHTDSSGRRGQGGVNYRAIGIENVSKVMMDYPDNLARWRAWWKRNDQIETLAMLSAWVCKTHDIPVVVSDGSKPGITTHWQVSNRFDVPAGHTDCWPRHLGGYFPLLRIVARTKTYRELLDF